MQGSLSDTGYAAPLEGACLAADRFSLPAFVNAYAGRIAIEFMAFIIRIGSAQVKKVSPMTYQA